MARRKSKPSGQPAWRPNFRNAETLPDIKLVRTDFLINLTTVSLAVLLVGLVFFREYRTRALEELTAVTQRSIESNIASDRRYVQMNGEFQRTQRAVAELPKFLNVPVNPDDLIFALTAMQPAQMILDSLSFSPVVTRQGRRETVNYQIVVNGTVRDAAPDGDARSATDIITDYRNAFGELPLLAPYFQSSQLSGFSRNESLGLFNFTVRVSLSMEPRK